MRPVDISGEVRSAFLDYAMSVIVARAIPDVRDGLKPVHRRIIFGMNELGMQPDKPYKKSARIVGDVMGKYHPHGDTALYSTLVRLAQPFSMRYTLVEGHGNFGSVDGDEAAAMRYTEARMSKISLEMVRDINSDTVDFVDNYDGTEKEPVVLPSRFPNLLVNGSSGIAVGMATNIPPHNLVEVINAVEAVAKNPEITPLDLMTTCLYGPDFPTGGIILGKGGIRDAYETGTGSIVLRSKTAIEEMENGKKRIIVSEIPYQVNKAEMIEMIAHLVKEKIIEGITDIRDESNKEGIRIVIELRRDVIPEVILNQLFKNTQLQISYGIIMLTLVGGQPKVLPVVEILKDYLDFQVQVIGRRTNFLLKKAEDRDHIVVGYLIAIDNIDEVVSIIRHSDSVDSARASLSVRFGLSEKQTKEILDMSLRRLTGLEKQRLVDERTDLEAKIKSYHELLADPTKVVALIINELEEIKAKFGDARMTEISNDISTIDDEDLIPETDIVVTLTTNGYIKRLATDTFRTQNRGGRGVKGMSTNENDVVSILLYAKTHTDLLFFTNSGKVYRIRGYQVPEYARTAKGLPVVNLLNLEKDEKVMSIISVDEYLDDNYLFFATKLGIVKRTGIKEFESIRQNGKIAIALRDGDQLLDVKHTDGHMIIGMASNQGKMVKFPEEDVRSMGRDTSGVKGMNVDGGEVIGVTTSAEGKYILVVTERGYGKMSPAEDYRLTSRGTKGVLTINATAKNGSIIAMHAVEATEDLMIITASGVVIRISLTQVKVSGRNTQGVRVIRLDEGQAVTSIAIVKPLPEIEEPLEGSPVVQEAIRRESDPLESDDDDKNGEDDSSEV
ncbi:MAG: DNA gyrase subunit A [Firmicutes bacterium]|nr:DNA gyrase subunit A [Bacillota bacterium]